MKQPICGVIPADLSEAPLMTVWPSLAVYPSGQFLGRLYDLRWPDLYILRLGHLLALLSIPVALVLYFRRVLPGTGVRYALTNRRIIVQRGMLAADERSLPLDGFDQLDVQVLPGQQWYDAGDVVFLQQGREVFRLAAVSRPQAFRQTCWKAHQAYVGVQAATRTDRVPA
jgi:hypothetical protein